MTSLTNKRIESLDLLKGLVIVIMALDHTRDYFHYSSYFFDPINPEVTTSPIFFTRFVSHFCAPAFSFLAGLSAFLVGQRKNIYQLSGFLLKRGIWLVLIEVIIINFGWHFDIYFTEIYLQVIWVLGLSMIFLSGLVFLPAKYLLVFSCVLIFAHNFFLDALHFEGNIFWTALHGGKPYNLAPGHVIRITYAIIPWIAVMSLGYCFGKYYNKAIEPLKRKKIFNSLGIAALVLFIILRATNIYGNNLPWKNYGNVKQDVFSFLNLTKYPPSLSFLLLTLGASLVFLANTEKLKGKIVNFFSVFGRVPFFFYIIHIYLIHFLALLMAGLTGFGWQKMILPTLPFRVEALKGFGYNLVTVYLIWLGVIAILYPVCKAFDNYKQSHRNKAWLSYL